MSSRYYQRFPFWCRHQEVYTHLPVLEPLRASFYFPLNPLRLVPFKDRHSAFPRGPKRGTCLLSGWLHRHLALPASFFASLPARINRYVAGRGNAPDPPQYRPEHAARNAPTHCPPSHCDSEAAWLRISRAIGKSSEKPPSETVRSFPGRDT